MHPQEVAIIKSLVSVAWADGQYQEKEKEMISALLDAYGATLEERGELLAYSKEKRNLEDIDLTELSAGDRRLLMHHAALLSYSDGNKVDAEQIFLQKLASYLHLSQAEAQEMIFEASLHAEKHIRLL